MKNFFYASLLTVIIGGAFAISSCTHEPFHFNYPIPTTSQACVPLNTNQTSNGDATLYPIAMSDIQALFASVGVNFDPAKVNKMQFTDFTLEVVGTGVFLNEILGVQIYIKSATNTTDDGTQVAYSQTIGPNQTAIVFSMTGYELKGLLSETQLILTIRVFNKPGGNAAICLQPSNGKLNFEVDYSAKK